MPFATATLNKFLDAAHGKATYTAPSNVYCALSTTTPVAAGTNFTEPSTTGTAYARATVPAASFGSAAAGAITNTTAIPFPTATGAGWGTVTYVGFFDSATVGAGNLLWFSSVTSQAIAAGVTPSIAIGDADSSLT